MSSASSRLADICEVHCQALVGGGFGIPLLMYVVVQALAVRHEVNVNVDQAVDVPPGGIMEGVA